MCISYKHMLVHLRYHSITKTKLGTFHLAASSVADAYLPLEMLFVEVGGNCNRLYKSIYRGG